MFNYIDPKEERNTRIAHMAANLCRNQHFDPTDALSKVASENALNRHEVEDVCAKLNHILFQEKFAEDKLAVFNAAQYDKVAGDGITCAEDFSKTASEQVQQAAESYTEQLEKRAADIAAMPIGEEEQMPQPDPIMENAAGKYKDHEFSRFLEQTATNASEISAHHMAIDKILEEMKERILALFREGVSLEEIYDTILMSVGDSQAPAVQQYFVKVIDELKAEGLMPKDQGISFDDPEKLAADFSIDEKLSKLAYDLKDNTNKVIIKEAAHEVALDAIAGAGRMDMAEQIDRYVSGNRMTTALEKNASFMDTMKNLGQKLTPSAEIKEIVKDKVLPSLMLGAGVAGMSAVGMGVSEGYREMRRNKIKKQLPNLYPELKEIPADRYSDLYDTITNLDPGMVKAPYAVAETIKKLYGYGTIDLGNILQLQGAHKPTTAITDFAIAPAISAMSNVAESYLKKSDKANGSAQGPRYTS